MVSGPKGVTMKKYYIVEYTLLIHNRRMYFRSNSIKSFCKLFALLKFKRCYKHKKSLKREILRVRREKKCLNG